MMVLQTPSLHSTHSAEIAGVPSSYKIQAFKQLENSSYTKLNWLNFHTPLSLDLSIRPINWFWKQNDGEQSWL